MSAPPVAVVGAAEDLALTGAGVPAPDAAEVVVVLGDAPAPAVAASVVRWRDGAADAGDGQRLIAQAGTGLWRRAPWPVADELFALAPPVHGAPVLVMGPDAREREAVVAELSAHGARSRGAERLTHSSLEQCGAVAWLGRPEEPLPAWLMAPLAARRPLMLVGAEADFGLQPGIDHLAARDVAEAAALAGGLAAERGSFRLLQALGAITAERHRATALLARLATDVRLEEAGGPRGTPPTP